MYMCYVQYVWSWLPYMASYQKQSFQYISKHVQELAYIPFPWPVVINPGPGDTASYGI